MQAWADNTDIPVYAAGSFDVPGMDDWMEDCEGDWRALSVAKHGS